MSNYPAQIDNCSSLPIAIDNLTPVQGSVFNALRNAVLAVESTLGIQPNGVYGSVANRLTTLEGTVGGIVEISLAGDLGNTLATPHVIGIQGHPVNSTAPATGQVFMWDIAWTPTSAGGDITGPYNSITVVNVNGVSYPASPATNTVPVVTGSDTVTYQAIANAQVSASAAIAVSKLAAGTSAQVLLNNSTPTPTWTTITGNVTLTNTGVATVTGIQGNTVTAGALVENQLLIATSTSNWAPTTVTGDVSFPSFAAGLTLVTGIQGNTVSSGYLIEGQFLVATMGGLGTSNWAPITLSGDLTASVVTPGKITVTGLAGQTVPVPDGYQVNNLLTWTGAAMEWSLPVNTVGPQSAFQHAYGQHFSLATQPSISVPGLIPVTSDTFSSYTLAVADPTATPSFFGPSVWFAGLNNLTRIDDNTFNISQIPLDDLPGFASFTTVPDIVAMATGPLPGVPNYTKLYAFDANLGLCRINTTQGSFGVEANLPISVFGGNSPTSIHFDSYALVGTFTVTNGLAAVTVDTSQTGVISVGSNITFGSQGAIYTVLTIDVTGTNITLTAPYTGVTPAFGTSAAINNNQLVLWFPLYNEVSTMGTLYFVSPDFSSVTLLLADISGISGGFSAWESGATATYANRTIFMLAVNLLGAICTVGVNTLTHATTHNIASTAGTIVGAPGNAMVFSSANNSLYLIDNVSVIYTLSLASNTQTQMFTAPDSFSGLAINDAITALTGNFTVTNGLPTVTASVSQTGVVVAGSQLGFVTQPGVVYTVMTINGGGTTITLTANYTGTSSAPTTSAFINNDELAAFTNTDFYLFHNLPGVLVSNGSPVTFSVAGPTLTPFGGLYKYFTQPNLTSVILDPAAGENFTGGPAYWVTDSSNNVVYNLAANLSGGPFITPLFNQLLQPGTSVSWQPGPFTAVNIGSSDLYTYTTTNFDHYVIVDTTGSLPSITLTSGVVGTTVVVMDGTGHAGIVGHSISVSDSGSADINGNTSYSIDTAYGAATFVFNGTNWNAY